MGLLTCGLCGGANSICGKDRYACANHANRGTCDNARTVKRQTIEARVLAGLKDSLLAPDLIEYYIAEYVKAKNAAGRDKDRAWTASRREQEEIGGRIASLLEALERGIITETTKDMAFHKKIASLSGNPIFSAISDAMLNWLFKYHTDLLHWSGQESVTLREHEKVIECIASGDPDSAASAMRSHLDRSNDLYRHH